MFLNRIPDNFPEIPDNHLHYMSAPTKSVVDFSMVLLHKLETRLKNWNVASIMGDIFVSLDFTPVYSKYLTNYDNSVSIIEWYSGKDQRFAKFIAVCSLFKSFPPIFLF